MVEENDTPSFSKELALNEPTSLLEMAQRVHDDFVANGKAKAEKLEFDAQKKHDELISSAREFHDISMLETESNAAAIIEDAQLSAFTLISDAKIKADSIVSGAQESILRLETSILKLQEFEAAYRSNLQALVAGAHATLAVAELEVEDQDLSANEDDEECLGGNDGLLESDEGYVPSHEPVAPIIYNFDNFDTSTYYDPLAVKPVLDSEVSASIIASSGLSEDTDTEDESTESEASEESETVDDAADAEDEAAITENGELVGISSETAEPIYYDPATLTSGTDPKIVDLIVGEPGQGKDITEEGSSEDESKTETDAEDEKAEDEKK